MNPSNGKLSQQVEERLALIFGCETALLAKKIDTAHQNLRFRKYNKRMGVAATVGTATTLVSGAALAAGVVGGALAFPVSIGTALVGLASLSFIGLTSLAQSSARQMADRDSWLQQGNPLRAALQARRELRRKAIQIEDVTAPRFGGAEHMATVRLQQKPQGR